MAQDPILGQAVAERLVEGIDVVNAFPDERTFAEEILIHVGDRAGVRIEAGLPSEQLGEAGPIGGG